VLGASSGQGGAVRAAQLLERGFGGSGLGWLKPALGTVDSLVSESMRHREPAR